MNGEGKEESPLPSRSSSWTESKMDKRQIHRRKSQSFIKGTGRPNNEIETERKDQGRRFIYFLDKETIHLGGSHRSKNT